MQLQQSPWTDDRIAELRKYFDRGWSCSRIGREINVTRNAVIGKLHRLGLSRPRDPVEKKAAKAPRNYSRHGNQLFKVRVRPILQRVYEAVERSPKNKTLLELEPGECKWPIGHEAPYLFCATDAVEGLPYCGYHAKLAYKPPGGGWHRPDAAHHLAKTRSAALTIERSMDREDGASAP